MPELESEKRNHFDTSKQRLEKNRGKTSSFRKKTSATAVATYAGEVGVEGQQILQCRKFGKAAKVCLQPLCTTGVQGDTARICKEDRAISRV